MQKEQWTDSSDAQLLEIARTGDTGPVSELWQRHHRAGLTAARNIAPHLEADDLVSEAYLKIFSLLSAGRGPQGAFRPYMYRVIRSLAADWSDATEISSDSLDILPDPASIEPWEDESFDKKAAAQAYASLSERWKDVLWYTEVEGLPPRQIAVFMGVSAHAIAVLASRAREALRSAWVEAHVSENLAKSQCKSTLKNLQRFQRNKLTAAAGRRVKSHLEECATCRNTSEEFTHLNRQLALVLAGLVVGAGAAPTLLSALNRAESALATPSHSGVSTPSPSSSASTMTSTASTAIGSFAAAPAVIIAACVIAATAVVGVSLLLAPQFTSSASPLPADELTPELMPTEHPNSQEKPLDGKTKNETESLEPAVTRAPPLVRDDQHAIIGAAVQEAIGVSDAPMPATTPEEVTDEEPVSPFDSSLQPGYLCYFENDGPGSHNIAGIASAPGFIKLRVTQLHSPTPVELIVANGVTTGTDDENWWFTDSLTPLNNWPGLVDGNIHDAVIEVQLLVANGPPSPWVLITLPNTPPPIEECIP